jgi:hypothetical protein
MIVNILYKKEEQNVPLFYDTDLFYFKVKLVLETNSSLSKTFTK